MEYWIISSSYITRLTLLWDSNFSFHWLMENNLYNDMNNCCKKCLSDRDLGMLDVELDMVGPTRVIDERVYLSHQNVILVLYKQIPWRLVLGIIGSSSICTIFSTDFIIIFYTTSRQPQFSVIATNISLTTWLCDIKIKNTTGRLYMVCMMRIKYVKALKIFNYNQEWKYRRRIINEKFDNSLVTQTTN